MTYTCAGEGTMSDEKERPMPSDRDGQVDAISRWLGSIFATLTGVIQSEYGVYRLYEARNVGTRLPSGADTNSKQFIVDLPAYVGRLEKERCNQGDWSFRFGRILLEIRDQIYSIEDYEKWRCSLPENEQCLHLRFNLKGLNEFRNIKTPMKQVSPPTCRSSVWVPNTLPKTMESMSDAELAHLCARRNIVVGKNPTRENLLQALTDNAEYE